MPADQGDAEQFAAADDRGLDPRSVGDPELARDLRIAALLRESAPRLAPRDDERARVRARVMARLAAEASAVAGPEVGPEAGAEAETAADTAAAPAGTEVGTASIAPVLRPAFGAADDTSRLPVVGDEPDGEPATVAPLAGRTERSEHRRTRGRHVLPRRAGGRPSPARRFLIVGAAALVTGVAIAGGGVFASRDALPGDSLYGVKRAAESVGDALTVGDAARAQRRLEAASTRVDEVQSLVRRDPSASVDAGLVQSAIRDFESSTGAGSRGVLDGQDAGGAAALAQLRDWAAGEVARLSALRASLPASARPGIDSSITLLDRLVARAEALGARSGCTDVTSGAVDDLGPLPATGPCTPRDGGAARVTGGGSPADPTPRSGEGRRGGPPTGPTGPGSGSAPDGPGAGVLPDVGGVVGGVTGSGGSGGSDGSQSTPTTTTAPTTTSAPPPLIELPPLLPGGSGIRIG